MKKNSFKVYDKVCWHYPEGRDCPSLKAAKRHITFAMRFLKSHKLLSPDGNDLFESGRVSDDFALTSEIVTPLGNRLLSKSYKNWLKQISYDGPLSDELFDNTLKEITARKGLGKVRKSPKSETGKKSSQTFSDDDSPIIYDQVSFHWPMAKARGCTSLAVAKGHLRVLMRWLAENNLLTTEGKNTTARRDIPDDFALTSAMLTPKGNALMMKSYDRWLRVVKYGEEPKTTILDKALSEM